MKIKALIPFVSSIIFSFSAFAQNNFLDHCDATTGWNSGNELTINSTDKKEGKAALQSTGDRKLEYVKVFPPFNSGATVETGVLQFWYYVSDVTKLGSENQIELTSSGEADKNEYNWDMGPLKNGWNLITKTFRSANLTGGEPDLNAINFFRIYRAKTAPVTTMIDGLQIIK